MVGDVSEKKAPESTGADSRYFGRLAEGVFEIPVCDSCSRWHFFPRVCCPFCGSEALHWAAPSGRGTVYSTTVVRRPDGGDYTVCLIDLQEGPRMMSRVVDMPPDAVRIGLPVQARIDTMQEGPLLVFVAEGGAA